MGQNLLQGHSILHLQDCTSEKEIIVTIHYATLHYCSKNLHQIRLYPQYHLENG